MKVAEIKKEFLVVNVKNGKEQRCICDDIDMAVTMAVVLNHWWIDDCIAMEIDEYTEDGECCALTPFGE